MNEWTPILGELRKILDHMGKKYSEMTYDEQLEVNLDREVFTEPETILKYCQTNKSFKTQYGEERVENCALVYYMKKTLNSVYKEEADRLQGVNKRKWNIFRKKLQESQFYSIPINQTFDLYDELCAIEWNMELVQSGKLTFLRHDYDICEKRLFLKVIDGCQRYILHEVKGDGVTMGVAPFVCSDRLPMMIIPLKSLVQGNGNNHKRYRKALQNLVRNPYETYEKDRSFIPFKPFLAGKYFRKQRKICVVLTKEFWEAFTTLDDYRILNTEIALSLTSIYCERIYEMTAGQKELTMNVDDLKKIFCLENRYKNNGDFIKRVVEPSVKTLQEKGIISEGFGLNLKRGFRNKITDLCMGMKAKYLS